MIYTQNMAGNRGSIKWIILIILGIIIASYFFDFSVQDAVEDEQTQENFSYIKSHFLNFYNLYLQNFTEPIINFFNEYIWSVFIENMENVQNGETTVFDEAAANVTINYN